MPFTRETGTQTYNSAEEVKEELERCGLTEKTLTPATMAAEGLESRLRTAMEWQRNVATSVASRAKDMLQEFQRLFD